MKLRAGVLKDKTERIQQRTSALRKKIQTRLDTLQHKTEKQNNEISSLFLDLYLG